MDEERIEQIVQSSKRMQEISEFATSDDVGELFEDLAVAVLAVTQRMQEATELSDPEIAAAVAGASASIVCSWFMDYQDE